MSCGCNDRRRCSRCFESWWRAEIASLSVDQLEELGRRLADHTEGET